MNPVDQLNTQPIGGRKLINVPVVHSSEGIRWGDRFGISTDLAKFVEQSGYDSIWQHIKHHLMQLETVNIRVYQDGWYGETVLLDQEERKQFQRSILRTALNEGRSIPPELSILLDLSISKRVILEQTEDKKLCEDSVWAIGEIDKIVNLPDLEDMPDQLFNHLVGRSRSMREEIIRLANERDTFVAHRIAATLQEGEVGILFMGAYHDVVSKLPPDIQVEPLTENLKEVTSEIAKSLMEQEEGIFRDWQQQNQSGGPERR